MRKIKANRHIFRDLPTRHSHYVDRQGGTAEQGLVSSVRKIQDH